MAFKGIGRAVSKGIPFAFAWAHNGGKDQAIEATDNKAMGFDYTHDVASSDHRDGTSAVFACSFDEPVHTISIRIIPIGDSSINTAEQARLHGIVPDVGTAVTLTGGPEYFKDGAAITGKTGSWIYKGGGTVGYTPDGLTEVTMTLYRHGFDIDNPTTFADAVLDL